MKRMRRNNTIILFVILLLSISIGYALINTNLKINGTANVTKQTWDIHFENIQVTEGSVTTQKPATINPEYPTTVTYNIHLENPGDFYEFEVDAVNNGSIDAMITNIVSTDNGQSISLPSYMEYKVTYSSGTDLDINHILEANTTETYKVGIYFKQDIQASDLANSDPLDLRLKFEVTYGQATDEATPTGDITVTLDPNGGTLSKTTKKVATNGKYGKLPTPTRKGYKFKGWHGVNEIPEVIESNYITHNYSDRTSHEFRSENNKKYIHITGNESTSNIDTYWYFATKDTHTYEESSSYVLSFDVRSQNCGLNQYIRLRESTAGGKTGIYLPGGSGLVNEYAIASLTKNLIFSNDGDWHRMSDVITISSGDTNGFLAIGNDVPNLYGNGCYLDIGNIQIQKGTTATPYEPYYITKNTKVVRTEDFTLTAEWEEKIDITFDPNGGVVDTASKTVSTVGTYGNLPTPTRTGYTFKGWSLLPSGYTQLEYIESTRTQYIDTAYVPKTNTKFELDLSFNGEFQNTNTYGGNASFIGVNDSETQYFSINYGGTYLQTNELFIWFNKKYEYDGQGQERLTITDSIRTNRNTLKYRNQRIQYGTVDRNLSRKEYDQTNPMGIFGSNKLTGATPFTAYNMRVYEFKIYEDDELVKYFIPCLNTTTNKEGLYDVVNDVFIGDATNQNFSSGNANIDYVSESTKILKTTDHTLTAIWEAE